jgi:hypothetical protein
MQKAIGTWKNSMVAYAAAAQQLSAAKLHCSYMNIFICCDNNMNVALCMNQFCWRKHLKKFRTRLATTRLTTRKHLSLQLLLFCCYLLCKKMHVRVRVCVANHQTQTRSSCPNYIACKCSCMTTVCNQLTLHTQGVPSSASARAKHVSCDSTRSRLL